MNPQQKALWGKNLESVSFRELIWKQAGRKMNRGLFDSTVTLPSGDGNAGSSFQRSFQRNFHDSTVAKKSGKNTSRPQSNIDVVNSGNKTTRAAMELQSLRADAFNAGMRQLRRDFRKYADKESWEGIELLRVQALTTLLVLRRKLRQQQRNQRTKQMRQQQRVRQEEAQKKKSFDDLFETEPPPAPGTNAFNTKVTRFIKNPWIK